MSHTKSKSSNGFTFTVKKTRGYPYLYIQKVSYKRGKRKVISYSLGSLAKINEIFNHVMSTANTFFLGGYLINCCAEKLNLTTVLMTKLKQTGATPRQVQLLQYLISLRTIRPFSKDKMSRFWEQSFLQTECQISHVNELYQAMAVVTKPTELFPHLAKQVLQQLDHQYQSVYYDTTTVFFYSDFDDLRRKGFIKKGKRGSPVVKLAVGCTEEYIPLTYKVFSGNTADITCFKDYLTVEGDPSKLIVFDSGCYSFDLVKNIEQQGYRYITSCDITKYQYLNGPQTVIIHDQKWTLHEATYNNHRVVEAYNEENHTKGLVKLKQRIQRVQEFAQEVKGRDRQSKRDKIRDLIKSLGLTAILKVELQEDDDVVSLEIDAQQLEVRQQRIKVMVLMTNLTSKAEEVVERYLRRDEVERVIRYLKSPLAIRPVFHSNTDMIRSHFFLVMAGFLQLAAFRLYLKQNHQITLTLEQVLEDLNFATVMVIEPKPGIFSTYAGRQVKWIQRLLLDWKLPIIVQETPMSSSSLINPS